MFCLKIGKKFPKFVLAPLRGFLNQKLDRLSLKLLECGMDSTGYTDHKCSLKKYLFTMPH